MLTQIVVVDQVFVAEGNPNVGNYRGVTSRAHWTQSVGASSSFNALPNRPIETSKPPSPPELCTASAFPSGLAQSFDQVGVVFRPKPRHAVRTYMSNAAGAREMAFSSASFASSSATQLTEGGGGPAIDHREIGV